MSAKIKLKFKDKRKKIARAEVKSIACNNIGVPFVRLYEIPDGYKAVCRDDEEVDKLLSNTARKEMEKHGLMIITPPEIKAKRSFFIRGMEEDVGENTADDFKNELEDKNPWLVVTDVIKIKNYTHVIKVECQETAMVEKVLNTGLKIFNTSILPDQITREEFVSILICFNCYKYEDHPTFNCPDKETKYCSECGEEGHKYTDCRNTEKHCLNCIRNDEERTDHRTLAMSCPLKKKLIKDKKETKKQTEEDKKNKTYAMVAKKAAMEIVGEKTEINLSDVTHFKILACIMHAHVLNLQNPGSYRTELNIMLENNGFPKMWFPENPDSASVLGGKKTTVTTTEQTDGEETEGATAQMSEDEIEGATAVRRKEIPKEQRKSRHVPMKVVEERQEYTRKDKEGKRDPRLQSRMQREQRQEQRKEHREQTQDTEDEPEIYEPEERTLIDGEELGLTIYITNKQHFPTRTPKRSDISKGIEQRTHKYIYENKKYNEDFVEYLIKAEKIEISKEDFKMVDSSKFKKIRNGPSKSSPQSGEGSKKSIK